MEEEQEKNIEENKEETKDTSETSQEESSSETDTVTEEKKTEEVKQEIDDNIEENSTAETSENNEEIAPSSEQSQENKEETEVSFDQLELPHMKAPNQDKTTYRITAEDGTEEVLEAESALTAIKQTKLETIYKVEHIKKETSVITRKQIEELLKDS